MKTSRHNAIVLLAGWLAATPALADSVIDLEMVKQKSKGPVHEPLRVLVHNGKALVGAVNPGPNTDVRFDQAQGLLQLIDHKHRTVMNMDEPSVIQLTDQAQQMLAMARGFSEQLALLPPKQRAKLENMLGGNPMGQAGKSAAKPLGKQSLRSGSAKTVAGISCRSLDVLAGSGKTAELCLANASALPLPPDDYATLEAMRQLAQRLIARAEPLAQQFGYPAPPMNDAKLAGLPVEMKNLLGEKRETITVTKVSEQPVSEESLAIPADYRQRPLSAWKF